MNDNQCRASILTQMTDAERRVVELVRNGLTNREIADTLCRSRYTVKTHVERILAKAGARNRAHLCSLLTDQNTPLGV